MFRRGLNLTLAVAMLVVGIPHALCLCNHCAAAPQKAVRVCPHCGNHQPGPLRDSQKPCQCGACEVIPAVPPSGAVSVAPPVSCNYHLAMVATIFAPVTYDFPLEVRAAGPPGLSTSAGRAIPIFLGHLLF